MNKYGRGGFCEVIKDKDTKSDLQTLTNMLGGGGVTVKRKGYNVRI